MLAKGCRLKSNVIPLIIINVIAIIAILVSIAIIINVTSTWSGGSLRNFCSGAGKEQEGRRSRKENLFILLRPPLPPTFLACPNFWANFEADFLIR